MTQGSGQSVKGSQRGFPSGRVRVRGLQFLRVDDVVGQGRTVEARLVGGAAQGTELFGRTERERRDELQRTSERGPSFGDPGGAVEPATPVRLAKPVCTAHAGPSFPRSPCHSPPVLEAWLDGFAFLEGPRWHDGRLWVSDMHDHVVLAIDESGAREEVLRLETRPSGLGWLPDGRLLVVSMTDRRLMRLDPDGLKVHADLGDLASWHCNDMVVDARGRAYVGNFGFDLDARAEPCTATLALVHPDGRVEAAADELAFPNGAVISPDGRTLIVGESFGGCLTAFRITDDGALRDRRVWARLEGAVPDGICLDADGAVWVASPVSNEVLRVREGGEVTHRVPTGQAAIACMLGGGDRRTLYVLTSKTTDPEEAVALRSARIDRLRVDVPGAGLP